MEFVRSGDDEKPSLERRGILSRDSEQTIVIAFEFRKIPSARCVAGRKFRGPAHGQGNRAVISPFFSLS